MLQCQYECKKEEEDVISSSSFKKLGSEKRSTTLAYEHLPKKRENGKMGFSGMWRLKKHKTKRCNKNLQRQRLKKNEAC